MNGPRARVLADEELAAIWSALPSHSDYADIVRLLVLTGCRREEIGALRWDEVDLDRALITLPGSRTKNKNAHEIPLAAAARAILEERKAAAGDRELVFGRTSGGFRAWSGSKAILDGHLGEDIPSWTIHDLRRTVSTRMHEIGIAPHIVEAVLNHMSGHKAGVAGTYNHARYTREKEIALKRWNDYVLAAAQGREHEAQVVPLRA